MEFDLTWVLLAVPTAFAAGWFASRLDLRQLKLETRSAPKSYFKGLNDLLNEQQDQAIDAFIEAVQQDPDTTELHFALGNLFRRRGDYDRAIRVHEHLLKRGDLSTSEQNRAQHALALDFTKAGILDRAETYLQLLTETPYRDEALLTLLGLYERTSDWPHAIDTAKRLEASGQGSFQSRIAHYLCETAREAIHEASKTGNAEHAAAGITRAMTCLQEARQLCPEAARPRIDIARLQETQGQPADACHTLLTIATDVPTALPLVAGRLAQLAKASGQQEAVAAVLRTAQAERPCIDFVEALVTLDPHTDNASAKRLYLDHLKQESSLIAASQWIRLQQTSQEGDPPSATECRVPEEVNKALTAATQPLRRYRCAACGFEAVGYFWQCPGCQSWDTYSPRRVEEL